MTLLSTIHTQTYCKSLYTKKYATLLQIHYTELFQHIDIRKILYTNLGIIYQPYIVEKSSKGSQKQKTFFTCRQAFAVYWTASSGLRKMFSHVKLL